jgi:adenine-specific DNA-methyltransferase
MKKIETGDPETMSEDFVAGNIQQLKALFPEAVKEGAIDFEVLRQILGGDVDEREEKYGLTWSGKRRARQLALTPSTGTLRPCRSDSVEWDSAQNLMIEGDNLEALKLLQKAYSGKIKLIYIDPPYNTGHDFVYPDDFSDSIANYLMLTGQIDSDGRKLNSNTDTSGRFHTSWLNMLYPRLKLARALLREDGVIFISINDKELANLQKMCCEVFGEENFIATLVWERGRKNDARRFSLGHEYIVGFAKHLDYIEEILPAWREPKEGVSEIVEEYHRLKQIHGTDYQEISAGLVAFYQSLPSEHLSKAYARSRFVDKRGIWRDNNISWPGGGGPKYPLLHPVTKKPCRIPDDGWRFIEDTMHAKIRDGYVEFREDHTKSPFLKSYLYIDAAAAASDEDTPGEKLQVMGSVFYRHSQPSNDVMKDLFGEKVFENPKDHLVLARLIRYCTGPEDTILDFFAGSGSTAHAVMHLNASEDSRRSYILVQLQEILDPSVKEQKLAANFCDSIGKPRNIAELTKERLRRAGNALKKDFPMFAGDIGFRAFRLDASNIVEWNPAPTDVKQQLLAAVDSLKSDRDEQDVLYEVLIKLGLPLTTDVDVRTFESFKVSVVGAGSLIACLAASVPSEQTETLALAIVKLHAELSPAGESQVVLRDSAFADDVVKTNLTKILEQHGLENVRSI